MKLRLLPIALLLLLGACRHKQAQPEMIYVDSATRQHFLFKPGSYWIYKDAVSGRVDSCYVTKLDSSIAGNNARIYQYIFLDMMQRPITNPFSNSITIGIGLGEKSVAFGYDIKRFLSDNDFGVQLSYPFKPGRTRNAPDSCVVVTIIPDTVLEGTRYFNVISCFSGKYNDTQKYAWLYINDSVGIIQISTYTDNVMAHQWELQRFHILK